MKVCSLENSKIKISSLKLKDFAYIFSVVFLAKSQILLNAFALIFNLLGFIHR